MSANHTCTNCNHSQSHSHSGCNKCNSCSCHTCQTKAKHVHKFEHCEVATYAAADVRYKIACKSESNLENLGINKGDDLDYIIDRLGMSVLDLKFITAPVIKEYPQLESFEEIILFLLEQSKQQQIQIAYLQSIINTLNVA